MPGKRSTKLTSRDRDIIEDVARHRIMTNEVLHKRHFPEHQPNAVTKVTARLCRARLLAKHPLYHPRSYFTLGSDAAQLLGVSPHRTYPLGPQALPTEFATLVYSTLGNSPQRRLTTGELQELCPWLIPQLVDFPHCLDESADSWVLELIRVDLGGKPDHVARKCDADIQVRLPMPQFKDLIGKQRFRLVVITGTTDKAAAVQDAIQHHVWPEGLSFHLAIVPELLQLTASLTDGA